MKQGSSLTFVNMIDEGESTPRVIVATTSPEIISRTSGEPRASRADVSPSGSAVASEDVGERGDVDVRRGNRLGDRVLYDLRRKHRCHRIGHRRGDRHRAHVRDDGLRDRRVDRRRIDRRRPDVRRRLHGIRRREDRLGDGLHGLAGLLHSAATSTWFTTSRRAAERSRSGSRLGHRLHDAPAGSTWFTIVSATGCTTPAGVDLVHDSRATGCTTPAGSTWFTASATGCTTRGRVDLVHELADGLHDAWPGSTWFTASATGCTTPAGSIWFTALAPPAARRRPGRSGSRPRPPAAERCRGRPGSRPRPPAARAWRGRPASRPRRRAAER